MTFKSLEEIKRLRKKYNLNQKELALRANVSQSLIAKIEAGKVEPTFSKAQQIFTALEELREKEETKAKEIMNRKVVFAQVSDSLKEIIKTMKKKGISQLPVLSREKVCGLITEGIIVRNIAENPERIGSLKAGDVMEEAPPIISINASMKMILELLHSYQIILVAEKGEIKGIISKTDVLNRI